MKKEYKISIVIPSYNKGKYIEETLKSIITQSYNNFEVIIQDGGSTDNSVEIIEKYAKKYPEQIQWVSQKDGGQLDAINKGMKKATGDILAFINADDTYEKRAFEIIVKACEQNPSALWFAGQGRVVNAMGKEIAKYVTAYKNLLLKINNYDLLLIVNYLMQPSVFITREAYDKYGPFMGTKKFVMEYDLWLKLGKVQMPIIISENLSKFRFEPNTISAKQSRILLQEDHEVVKKYTSNFIISNLHLIHNKLRLFVYSK